MRRIGAILMGSASTFMCDVSSANFKIVSKAINITSHATRNFRLRFRTVIVTTSDAGMVGRRGTL